MARIAPTGRQSGDLKLYPVAPDVYLYRGFFSNSGVLVLPGGVVVVDTQITPMAGERLRKAIAAVTDKPITHVINTHYHGDHAGGNLAFPDAEIIATAETERYIHERDEERLDYARTFGLQFQDVPAVAPPTRTFTGKLSLDVGGEVLELFQAGRVETPDACVVWWPSRKVLLPGDGVATVSYPYLGVPFLDEGLQDDGQWIEFLRTMKGLGAEYVLAGHGQGLQGKERIEARLDLLIALFTDLFAAVKEELAKNTPLAELVLAVDAKLARYARHKDLEQNTVSQRFAIYRAYNSARPDRRGKGWWHDFRPSVIKRASAEEAKPILEVVTDQTLSATVRGLAKRHGPLAHTVLEGWLAAHPDHAAAHALLADVLFDSAAGISPVVDATEYIAAAAREAKAALALDATCKLALLNLGCIDIWSAMVLAQSMAPGIARITAALEAGDLTTKQRRKAAFFLGKAHQFELRDEECDRWLRQAMPAWLRFAYPLVRHKLRSIP